MHLKSDYDLKLPLKESLQSPGYTLSDTIDFSRRSCYVLEQSADVIFAYSAIGSFVVLSATPYQLDTRSVHIGVRLCRAEDAQWFRECLRYSPQHMEMEESVYSVMEAVRNLGKACVLIDMNIVDETIAGAMSSRKLISIVQKLRLVQNIDTLIVVGCSDTHIDLVSKLCSEFA